MRIRPFWNKAREHEPEEPPAERYCPVCRTDLTHDSSGVCPQCARPFDPQDPATTSPLPHALCSGCGYDMLGLDAAACPECNTPFDALGHTPPPKIDPRARRRNRVALACVLGGLALFFLVRETWIPRPALDNRGGITWTVWIWLGKAYGTDYIGTTPNIIRVEYDASIPVRAAGYVADANAQTGASVGWRLTREAGDEWRLEILRPGVPWQDILLGFNTTRTPDEVLGVRLSPGLRERSGEPLAPEKPAEGETASDAVGAHVPELRGALARIQEAAPAPNAPQPPLRPLTGLPVSVTGDSITILSALVDHYGLGVLPGITHADDNEVWLTDETGTLVSMTPEEAIARGHELPAISGYSVSRLRARFR